MAKPELRIVDRPDQPEPDMTYEHELRRRIAARNWAAVHVRGDRAPPLYLPNRPTRGWRG